MDLTKELLDVLDNPSDVWTAVVNSLTEDTRITLMVFATQLTPVDLRHWQAGVARIDAGAATVFQRSLETLDDTFVSTQRTRSGEFVAQFRNPSMDDFCAVYLDLNVGFLEVVLNKLPDTGQLIRLVRLATSQVDGRRRYNNIYSAVLGRDAFKHTVRALIDAYEAPRNSAQRQVLGTILSVFGRSKAAEEAFLAECRARLRDPFDKLALWGSNTTYVLDNRVSAIGISRILGDEFSSFYERLWKNATTMRHFDSIVNLEDALSMQGNEAEWRDSFVEHAARALEELDDASTAVEYRDYYDKVAEHLDLQDDLAASDWAEAARELAERDRPDDDDRQDDDDWESEAVPTWVRETEQIDAMFHALAEAERPD